MNELIKIDYSNDRPAVSARELHGFLEVGTRFNDGFPRMCEYGFSEGQDFYSILSEGTGGRPFHRHGQGNRSHDCEKDCALFEKCKIIYLDGDVIKCMHFGNKKNFGGLKK